MPTFVCPCLHHLIYASMVLPSYNQCLHHACMRLDWYSYAYMRCVMLASCRYTFYVFVRVWIFRRPNMMKLMDVVTPHLKTHSNTNQRLQQSLQNLTWYAPSCRMTGTHPAWGRCSTTCLSGWLVTNLKHGQSRKHSVGYAG